MTPARTALPEHKRRQPVGRLAALPVTGRSA